MKNNLQIGVSMTRFKLTIEYDGTNYVGWQKQLNGLSIQECLENALSTLFQILTQATASGRTDSGVHAKGQVVHFNAETSMPAEKIPYALNTLLPTDISALSCEIADDSFNARFGAKRKTYCYKLYCSSHRHPTLERDHAHIVQQLNIEKMRQAALLIVGEHDFKCFEASGSVVKETVRTIFSLDIVENSASCKNAISIEDTQKEESKDILNNSIFFENTQEIEITVCGNGFLYNMVRIIAGTLVYVGLGKIEVNEISKLIESRDRTHAGKTLPPNGLCLMSVEYKK
ncbi:MAG: tRNA pseudouridine synthase A [Clostridia bacterium]|nr:tRNA pseudouridine synthase A [Clostridia bacterium]